MNKDCIFCKIINGEIPSTKLYEDETVLAILDINPVNEGHTLVMPKEHYENMEVLPEIYLVALAKTVKKVGLALKSGLNIAGYNVVLNNDPIAGQLIPHFHWHVIPRLADDALKVWPQRQYEAPEKMNEVAEKIRQAL